MPDGNSSEEPSVLVAAEDPNASIRKWYLITLFIACFGGGMISLASTYIIYNQTGSLSVTGLIVVATNLPSLVFPGWATRLANRWGGAKLYFISAVALGVIGLVPAILLAMGDLTTASLLAWYLAGGAIFGLSSPAAGLLRRSIAAPGQVPEFNSAATRSVSIATVLGLLTGGALFAAVGPTWIYIISAVAHFPICFAVYPAIARDDHENVSGGRFKDSFAIRKNHHGLRSAFYFTGFCFLISCYGVTFPAMAAAIGSNAGILSLLQAAAVFGGLFVVVAIRKIHGRVGWGTAQRACFLVAGVGILVLAWINHRGASPGLTLVIALVAIVPVGFALNLDASILNALVQVAAPREARNAVLTYYALIPTMAIPVSQELLGGLSDLTSVSTALVVVGSFTLFMIGFGPQRKIRSAFDTLGESEEPPSGFPVAPQLARPEIVTAHAPVKRWTPEGGRPDGVAGPEETYGDVAVETIEAEAGPIADQHAGLQIPDRPESER